VLLTENMQGCCALDLAGVGDGADLFSADAFSYLGSLASSSATIPVPATTSTLESSAYAEPAEPAESFKPAVQQPSSATTFAQVLVPATTSTLESIASAEPAESFKQAAQLPSSATTFAQVLALATTSTPESSASAEPAQQINPVQFIHIAEAVKLDAEQVALQEVDSDEVSADASERYVVGEKRQQPATSDKNTTPTTKTMKSEHINWRVTRPRHTGMAFLIYF